jgi:hypothetical protein
VNTVKTKIASIEFRYGMSLKDTWILSDDIRGYSTGFNKFTYYEKTEFPHSITWRVKMLKAKNQVKADLLYSILACISSDYYIPDTFEDFCHEFGYDTDSMKAESIYHDCLFQSKQLKKVFTDAEIQCLPR